MRSFDVLALTALLLPSSLAGPVHQRHAHFHEKRVSLVSGAIIVEVLEALGVEYPGLAKPKGVPEATTTAAHHHSGNHTAHHNSTSINTTTNATTTSFSRSFSLGTAAPTETAPYANNSTNITSSLKPTAPATTSSLLPTHPHTTSTLATLTTAASSSTPISTSSSATATPSAPANDEFLRGVNIGNWLVLEKWMDSTNMFSGAFAGAVDQYSFDSIPGAAEALQSHWSTWFTQDDMKSIAATGINAVRIPIGYWAYNNAGTPYIQGADAYLEQAIGWAQDLGMKVWVDCHGSPGSQNGFDNSGKAGSVLWQTGDNIQASIAVLKTMATKYGAVNYSSVIAGLELVNEPVSWDGNTLAVTQKFASDAYTAVKSSAANPNLNVIMHDAFMPTASNWLLLPSEVGTATSRAFGMDTHLYQVFDEPYTSMDGPAHITAACAWSVNLATTNPVMPITVGEWSASEDICVNPDGSTTSGTSCSVSGCQCTSAAITTWNDSLKEYVGKFVEAQLDTFEQNASGYFIWAYKGPGGWGFDNLIEYGIMPNPVTSRNYAAQCG